jgi:hypothetical protein
LKTRSIETNPFSPLETETDLTVKSFNVPASIVLPSLMCSRLILSLLAREPNAPIVLKPFPMFPDEEEIGRKAGRVSIVFEDSDRVRVVQTPGKLDDSNVTLDGGVVPAPVAEDGANDAATSSLPLLISPEPLPHLLPLPSLLTTPPINLPMISSRPILATRPSLTSRKSEATLESIKSRRSQASDPLVLAIQVTTETVVSVAVDEGEDETRSRRSRPTSTQLAVTPPARDQSRERLNGWPFPEHIS